MHEECPQTVREQFDDRGKKVKRESDANTQMGRSLNTITPCAACKLLRRRCAEDCPFSPYFSPHEPFKFAAVHKVFGASNVSKMLMDVPESQRADAANSLVYEANVRLRDPIYGCIGAISALQQEIQSLQAQLNAVRAEILSYRYRQSLTNSTTSAASVSSATSIAEVHHRPHQPPPPPPPPQTPPRSSAVMFPSSISSLNCSSISCGNILYFD